MFLAHVICSIVNRCAVTSRSLHHVYHHFRNIDLVTSRKGFPVRCLVVCVSLNSCGVFFFFLLKEGSDSVLSSKLLPCFFRQVVNNFTSESYTRHGVQYDFVGYHVTYSQHFAVETCFCSVYVLPFPQSSCDHGSAEIYKH